MACWRDLVLLISPLEIKEGALNVLAVAQRVVTITCRGKQQTTTHAIAHVYDEKRLNKKVRMWMSSQQARKLFSSLVANHCACSPASLLHAKRPQILSIFTFTQKHCIRVSVYNCCKYRSDKNAKETDIQAGRLVSSNRRGGKSHFQTSLVFVVFDNAIYCCAKQ
jgi:hypothetical protein